MPRVVVSEPTIVGCLLMLTLCRSEDNVSKLTREARALRC